MKMKCIKQMFVYAYFKHFNYVSNLVCIVNSVRIFYSTTFSPGTKAFLNSTNSCYTINANSRYCIYIYVSSNNISEIKNTKWNMLIYKSVKQCPATEERKKNYSKHNCDLTVLEWRTRLHFSVTMETSELV